MEDKQELLNKINEMIDTINQTSIRVPAVNLEATGAKKSAVHALQMLAFFVSHQNAKVSNLALIDTFDEV